MLKRAGRKGPNVENKLLAFASGANGIEDVLKAAINRAYSGDDSEKKRGHSGGDKDDTTTCHVVDGKGYKMRGYIGDGRDERKRACTGDSWADTMFEKTRGYSWDSSGGNSCDGKESLPFPRRRL